MRLLLLFILGLGGSAGAQSLGVVCPSSSAKPVVCTIISSVIGASGVQWVISTNVPNSGMSVSSRRPDKSAANNGGRMLMFGMNSTPMPLGILASVSISFPSGWKCPGNSPCLTVTLSLPQACVNNHSVRLTASPASATVRVPK